MCGECAPGSLRRWSRSQQRRNARAKCTAFSTAAAQTGPQTTDRGLLASLAGDYQAGTIASTRATPDALDARTQSAPEQIDEPFGVRPAH